MQSKRTDEEDRRSLTLNQYCWSLFPSMIPLIREVGFHSCLLSAPSHYASHLPAFRLMSNLQVLPGLTSYLPLSSFLTYLSTTQLTELHLPRPRRGKRHPLIIHLPLALTKLFPRFDFEISNIRHHHDTTPKPNTVQLLPDPNWATKSPARMSSHPNLFGNRSGSHAQYHLIMPVS